MDVVICFIPRKNLDKLGENGIQKFITRTYVLFFQVNYAAVSESVTTETQTSRTRKSTNNTELNELRRKIGMYRDTYPQSRDGTASRGN